MNKYNVSIIIPIYNTSEYIRRCLDSCIYQTLSDIEIVAVVDGYCNRREMEIIAEYERDYPKMIHSVFLTDSKGPAEARNEALRIAKGEYTIFVDSDDFIDFKLCEKVFNTLKMSSADIGVFDYYYMRNGVLGLRQTNDFSDTANFDDIPFYINKIRCWLLMIKTDLIVKNNLFFTGFYGEDIVTCLWYAASKKVIKINEPLYYYVYRNNSSVNEMKGSKFWKLVENYVDVLKHPFCKSCNADFVSALSFCVINYLCGYWLSFLISYKKRYLYDFCKKLHEITNVYGFRFNENKQWESERVKQIICFYNNNNKILDFNERFVMFYNNLDFNIINKRLMRLKQKLKNKKVILWAAGHYGKIIANAMLRSNMKFETTDIDSKSNRTGALVSWDLVKHNSDVVLVTGSEFVEGVKLIVDNNSTVYDLQKYFNGEYDII